MSKLQDKNVLVFYFSIGYILEESIFPLIESLWETYDIFLLMDSEFLTEKYEEKIHTLFLEKKIKKYNFLPNRKNIFNYQYEIINYCKKLEKLSMINAFLLLDDFSICSRYLIRFSKSKSIKTFVLSLCSNWPLISKFIKQKNYIISDQNSLYGFKRSKNELKGLIISKLRNGEFNSLAKKLIIRILTKTAFLKEYIFKILNFIILPIILKRLPFLSGKWEKFRIPGDNASAIIVFDDYELKAYKYFIKKPIFLLKHPAENIKLAISTNSSKILIIFSGCLSSEMNDEDIRKWCKYIIQLSNYKNSKYCDLRLHPRTKKDVAWPTKISNLLRESGLEVSIIFGIDQSLIMKLGEYSAILGGPSGALLITSLIRKDILILGLDNSQDHGLDDQFFTIGNPKNIYWLKKSDFINTELFNENYNKTKNYNKSFEEFISST